MGNKVTPLEVDLTINILREQNYGDSRLTRTNAYIILNATYRGIKLDKRVKNVRSLLDISETVRA